MVERQFLLTTVWADAAVEENSLSRAIADIRKVLGEGAKENRFIATVARRGYRFVAEVSNPKSASATGRSAAVAVLPFAWLTPEGGDRSLAVGLADALIARLSNLNQIIVRPTNSILRYAGGKRDPMEIAAELKVDFVISGSLQQAGDRVRVTVQMVSPDQHRSVWADHFEETFTHIFSVEDSISARVAAALALKLTNAQRQSLGRHSTENHEAYQLYLRGRYFWSGQTFASAQKAIAYFHQAIDLDPRYALAWAGIADAQILIGLSGALTGGLAPHQVYPEAKHAALKAIELDETLAEAHASLGFIRAFYDWDTLEAQQEFHRALALQPNYASAHHGCALAYGFQGQHDASLRKIEAALEIEPLSLIFNANKGYLLYVARRYDEAVDQLLKTLEIDPAFAPTHYRLALAGAAQGRHDAAILHLQEAQRFSDGSPSALGALGYIYAKTGREQDARTILRQLTETSKSRYVSPVISAEICTGLGQYADTLEWLEQAVQQRSGALFTFNVDPRFDCLRSEPRFQRVLQNLLRST
jgi:TolB-like protein/tetratricopeptide (TPR) repeat protein